MNDEPVAYENTDKEIWRAIPDDYYSPSIFVTKENNIGINVGGHVYVKTVEQWHKNTHPVKELTLTEDEIDDVWAACSTGESDTIDMHLFAEAILKKAQEK